MAQNFTISVPDQLWVDDWDGNTTKTYTYDGPDTVYVEVDTQSNQVVNTSLTTLTPSDDDRSIIEVTAADYPERAMMVLEENDSGASWTFEDETNFDGSTYNKITNPRISDYFELSYHPIPADWDPERGLELEPIYKEPRAEAHEIADKRMAYVKRYADQYDFDSDTQSTLDTYMTSLQTHITTLSTAYPWKFDGGVPTSSIPKVPASLVTAFNALPDEVS